MSLQPAFAVAKELFDFVFSHPVVFVRIKHWDQHIKMGQQILQGDALADLHGVVRPFAPLGKLLIKRMVFRENLIPQRFEQSTQEFFAATTRQDGESRSKREWNGYEFRAIFAVSRQRGIENPSDGDTHEGRSHVGAVVYILIEHSTLAGRSASSPDESNWVNI